MPAARKCPTAEPPASFVPKMVKVGAGKYELETGFSVAAMVMD